MIRPRDVPLWVWWMPVVWAISFPSSGLTSRPQWDRVHPIPFTDPADRPRDVLANIALFIPFGFSYGRRGAIWQAVAIAAALSLSAEATQLFSTTRFPSATDVTAAAIGAALGAIGASLLTRTNPGGQEKASPVK
jgi:glycopeptide antibiotics resistance protein